MTSAWLRLRIGGQRWVVFLVSSKSKHLKNEDGVECQGRCVYDKARIYISRDLSDDVLEDTLIHELLHAVLSVTGADEAYGRSEKTEERIVKAITPAWHQVLKDLGLRLPKRDGT